ncbi:DUF3854 domain-containing protein [Dendronalium sp. ChiSLP03b]|uniref:DUF3854 domain-containing protein n=1 Tax=Dendronalium sp. ChiSLP03b TaxID=3075381 RepID=UPI002AD284E2|nr:DUF3854 domain-containing protein [Dendronalium sp. ChiSLP03b]MDZ8203529.1 DUF3854 domain-containing protein [Dendronalium sp. ChiSLP03b]
MFDERHLQLAYSYAKINEYFLRNIIYPLLDWASEKLIQKIEFELDKRLKLELGESTYVMRPDENGGWKWSKFDKETNEFINAEFEEIQEVEELLTELLTPLLPAGDALPLLKSSTAPPDLPPSDSPLVVSPSDKPPFLPPSTISVEEIAIPVEQKSIHRREVINNNSVILNSSDLSDSTEPSTFLDSLNSPTDSTSLVSKDSKNYLEPNHRKELVDGSAIYPEIAELNFKSLETDPIEQSHQAWEYLMYSDKISRRNDGRLRDLYLDRYQHIEKGGWWCDAGVDPRSFSDLQPNQQPLRKLWGCYKPNEPRYDKEKPDKKIKYEHPPKTELSIFLLDVPDDIAVHIYDKAGVDPSQSDRTCGFWYCVWKHNVPVTITEGAKKAACLLSQGEAAIGLPGIYAGYRSRDELGNPITPTLHPELAVFASSDRNIKICFDYETRLKTKRNINIATYRTGQHSTRDIEVPVHPQIAKHLQDLEQSESQNQTQNSKHITTTERPKKRQSNFQTSHHQNSQPNPDSVVLPLHSELARHWRDLEDTNQWLGLAIQGSNEFRSLIQNNALLTMSEQRELYFVLQTQAQAEIQSQGITDIILSPLNEIVKDLRQQSPLSNQANFNESERDTQLPLHREIARHWQDLEINKTWVGVADQWNYPLRQKLKQTGKLTIGEQREIYQKLLVQSSVEQNRKSQTDISLPLLSEILQDLMDERKKVIDNTYSPKVEVRSPQPKQHQNPKSTSVDLEL